MHKQEFLQRLTSIEIRDVGKGCMDELKKVYYSSLKRAETRNYKWFLKRNLPNVGMAGWRHWLTNAQTRRAHSTTLLYVSKNHPYISSSDMLDIVGTISTITSTIGMVVCCGMCSSCLCTLLEIFIISLPIRMQYNIQASSNLAQIKHWLCCKRIQACHQTTILIM